MKKVILILLIFSLLILPVYANSKPVYSTSTIKVVTILLPILTFGVGYLLFKGFTNKDKVEFTNEEINISINKNNVVNVHGYYHFKRNSKSIKAFKIVYPFPAQKQYGEVEIDSITINNQKAKYYQFELEHHDKISLTLYFDNNDECELRISFTQKSPIFSYKYILKSTRKWKKKLKKSVIDIELPDDLSINSNFNNLVLINEGKRNLYQMVKKNFYPDKDLLISWQYR